MAYHRQRESSMKQLAYAKGILGATGINKKQIALDVGYSPAVANSISSHIENKPGFHNAMAALAVDSNNLALAAMHEFKARGFHDFTNKELVGALNAIGNAWSKFNDQSKNKDTAPGGNNLRKIVLNQIENQTNQTVVSTPQDTPPVSTTPPEVDDKPTPGVVEVGDVENELDF